jgi:hypothetical protein
VTQKNRDKLADSPAPLPVKPINPSAHESRKSKEKAVMTTQAVTSTKAEKEQLATNKIQQLRDMFADAPAIGKTALEKDLQALRSDAFETPPPPIESAGRVGSRLDKVSELTIIVPLAPGGAKRLRAFLRFLNGNLKRGGDLVGTLHDMRFVFFDNDTRLVFATKYDGDWDTYIDDFVAKIPDYLDIIDSAWDGWPGIRSPHAKDYLASHQFTAEGWYVAHPDLTVAETTRLKRIGKAVDEFLDKVGD